MQALLKMAEASINDLLPGVPYDLPKSDAKRQKLTECVLTRNSKQYLVKAYTEEQINKVSAEEVDKLFSNYEAKLLGQMVKSLGRSIMMYLMGACATLERSNQDMLNEDLSETLLFKDLHANCITDSVRFWHLKALD